MKHVFISYHRSDTDFATVLRMELEKAGYEVWLDESAISAGKDWRSEIDQGIRDAGALIAVMSPEAAKSEYVTYEWGYALGRGIRVVPVLVRSTTVHPRLEAIQYLDFSSYSARPWQKLLSVISQAYTSPSKSQNDAPEGKTSVSVIEKAVTALDSIIPDERRLAIETLAQSNDPVARKTVMQTLHHSLLDVRVAAGVAVSTYDSEVALPSLIEGLAFDLNADDRERRMAFEVRNALVEIG